MLVKLIIYPKNYLHKKVAKVKLRLKQKFNLEIAVLETQKAFNYLIF